MWEFRVRFQVPVMSFSKSVAMMMQIEVESSRIRKELINVRIGFEF